MKDGDYYIWTHKKLEIGYNGDQIVDVNLTSDSKVKLVKDTDISFSYEVSKGACVLVIGKGIMYDLLNL